MAETITLEGDAARALREAARRAGYGDVEKYVVTLAPPKSGSADDPEERRRMTDEFFRRLRDLGRHYTMTTEEVMEMTRGKDWNSAVPFDDDDDESPPQKSGDAGAAA